MNPQVDMKSETPLPRAMDLQQKVQAMADAVGRLVDMANRVAGVDVPVAPAQDGPSCLPLAEVLMEAPKRLQSLAQDLDEQTKRLEGFLL